MFINGKLFNAFLNSSPYMGPELFCGAEGDGAGGGGGGKDNTGGLSQEAMDAIESRVTTMLQGGISSAMKRMEKQSGDKMAELAKLIEGLKPATKTEPVDEPGDEGRRSRGKGTDRDVDFATMQQKLQTQQDLLETIKRDRDFERSKNRESNLRQLTTRHLTACGVTDPINQDLAITNLIAKGILGYESEDSDRVVWRSNGDAFDAEQGFRQWSRSPEGQRLISASGVRGSGSSRGNGQVRGAEMTPEETARAAWRALGDNID